MEPRLGGLPFTLNGGCGDLHDFRHFFDAEAREKAQFYDAALTPVEHLQPREHLVNRHHVAEPVFGDEQGVVEGHSRGSSAFGGVLFSSIVNEDLPHKAGGDSEEMRAVLPFDSGASGKAHKGFVDKGGGLERMAWTLIPHRSSGDAAQFAVDCRHEFSGGVLVAPAELPQEACNISGAI